MSVWGIIPAAGAGTRIQPLAFSKELLPVGSRLDGTVERPRAVSEYLIARMIAAGARKLCFVISPGKWDIVQYYGAGIGPASACYAVQPQPLGLCDAIFRAAPMVHRDDRVLVGLPDTVWFPEDGLCALPAQELAFLLFPVERPEFFDAVLTDADGQVVEIQVKRKDAGTNWIWGAFAMPGAVFHELCALWQARGRRDEYLGPLVNAYIAAGGRARGLRSGRAYVDVGTLNGYRAALRLLNEGPDAGPAAAPAHPAVPSAGTDRPSREPQQAEQHGQDASLPPHARTG